MSEKDFYKNIHSLISYYHIFSIKDVIPNFKDDQYFF